MLAETPEVRTKNGRHRMSREEAIVRKIVADALRCDQKACARFLKLAKQAGELKDLRPPCVANGPAGTRVRSMTFTSASGPFIRP